MVVHNQTTTNTTQLTEEVNVVSPSPTESITATSFCTILPVRATRVRSREALPTVHTKSENVKMPSFLGKFTKLFPCNFTSIIISKITNFKFVILQSIW